jgi:outer membrane lipoprotein LolB
MSWALAACCALTVFLAGCATVAPPAAPDAAAVAREYHPSIGLGGRLSVRYAQGATEEAVHGSFRWSQTPQRTTVSLLSPLGQTLAIIEVAPGNATLFQSGQPPRSAPDADTLAASALGWPMPVAGLRDWLQGFAIDAAGQNWRAQPNGPTEVITRDGWRLSYPAWENGRPRRVDLSRGTQAGPVAMRIVIDDWQPG